MPSLDNLGNARLTELPEERRTTHTAGADVQEWELLLRVSNYPKAVRCTAYVMRFVRRHRPATTTLTAAELRAAKLQLLRLTQLSFLPGEIRQLRKNAAILNRSPLTPLRPYLDENGLLRVGGRLRHSRLSQAENHPIILSRTARMTELLVQHAHLRAYHGGVQLTLAILRREFWIPAGRSLVRDLLHRCVTCVRHRASPFQPVMAPLPSSRVTPAPPFSTCGNDYAGPISVRTSKGRGHRSNKGYIAVFVCFVTRAVHLEVASDYSADAFLAAFQRFSVRRGVPATVYSDQGTTFVGADRELRTALRVACAEGGPIATTLAGDGSEWRFQPPSAPHFGGLWEAGVRSVKHHLRRVVGERTLTHKELSTFLARVEACLNSRPLHPLSDDPDDLNALTTGHFLIGRPLISVPEPSLADISEQRLSRWQALQQMTEHLWSRWSREYLHTLQARRKWTKDTEAPRIGELVVVIDERLPPSRWLLARIVALHEGPDGHVRVARIRTAETTLTRPLVKLVRLPIEDRRSPN